jgi:hypothetical protein
LTSVVLYPTSLLALPSSGSGGASWTSELVLVGEFAKSAHYLTSGYRVYPAARVLALLQTTVSDVFGYPTAVFITIGPAYFSTLMGFLSASTLGKPVREAADSGRLRSCVRISSAGFRFVDRAKHAINKEKSAGPIVLITAVN